jgi:FdhD protein
MKGGPKVSTCETGNFEHIGEPASLAASNHLRPNCELGWPSHSTVMVNRWREGESQVEQDQVAEEAPIALLYNGNPHVVMLATPLDLEDFAIGFSLTEGLIANPAELLSVRAHQRAEGIEVRIRVPEERFQASIASNARNLTGRTGCGLCGSATLRQAVKHPPPVGPGAMVGPQDLQNALAMISEHQSVNRITGAVHAAAWYDVNDRSILVREDVGRHNALDKLIGALVRRRNITSGGFAVVTSRASYEMVQKCASAGIALLAAISAPTGLAIRLAEETGLTLIGFARGENCVIYANSNRWLANTFGP